MSFFLARVLRSVRSVSRKYFGWLNSSAQYSTIQPNFVQTNDITFPDVLTEKDVGTKVVQLIIIKRLYVSQLDAWQRGMGVQAMFNSSMFTLVFSPMLKWRKDSSPKSTQNIVSLLPLMVVSQIIANILKNSTSLSRDNLRVNLYKPQTLLSTNVTGTVSLKENSSN